MEYIFSAVVAMVVVTTLVTPVLLKRIYSNMASYLKVSGIPDKQADTGAEQAP